jgi:hypothetical protein
MKPMTPDKTYFIPDIEPNVALARTLEPRPDELHPAGSQDRHDAHVARAVYLRGLVRRLASALKSRIGIGAPACEGLRSPSHRP